MTPDWEKKKKNNTFISAEKYWPKINNLPT